MASNRMIGSGTPNIHSRIPRPMVISSSLLECGERGPLCLRDPGLKPSTWCQQRLTPRWRRGFAFNAGVKTMQLVVVAAVLPSLIFAARTRAYGVVRVVGAGIAAAVS